MGGNSPVGAHGAVPLPPGPHHQGLVAQRQSLGEYAYLLARKPGRPWFDSRHGYVKPKHSKEDEVVRDANGDVTQMSGTITDVPERNTRRPNRPKHAKR